MTAAVAERAPLVWRTGLSGSRNWRMKWRARLEKDLDEQLYRLRPGDTFILRHGGARNGADHIAHLWFVARAQLDHGITMIEEIVAADWEHCVDQPYRDVTGKLITPCSTHPRHRRQSRHSTAPDGCICPRRGQLRNPDVAVHPDYPLNVFLAYCIDNSPGTMKTIEYARDHYLDRTERYFYTPAWRKQQQEAAAAVRHDRGAGGGDGEHLDFGGDLHDVELPGT